MTFFSIPKRRSCLGVALGGRCIAIAVVSQHRETSHMPVHVVARLRRIKTEQGRDRLFRDILERHLLRYPVDVVSVVWRDPASMDVKRQQTIVAELCTLRGLSTVSRNNAIVRETLVQKSARVTNRDLGRELQRRLPQLDTVLPDNLTRGAPELSRFPSTQERYWFRLYMAVGAAVCELDHGNPATPAR